MADTPVTTRKINSKEVVHGVRDAGNFPLQAAADQSDVGIGWQRARDLNLASMGFLKLSIIGWSLQSSCVCNVKCDV